MTKDSLTFGEFLTELCNLRERLIDEKKPVIQLYYPHDPDLGLMTLPELVTLPNGEKGILLSDLEKVDE